MENRLELLDPLAGQLRIKEIQAYKANQNRWYMPHSFGFTSIWELTMTITATQLRWLMSMPPKSDETTLKPAEMGVLKKANTAAQRMLQSTNNRIDLMRKLSDYENHS